MDSLVVQVKALAEGADEASRKKILDHPPRLNLFH